MSKKNNLNFILNTDWVFDGILDSEQKQYILLNYFQKLNKNLEEMKIYPMFTELSLHLGNIQSLLNQNRILYTEKTLKSYDDELIISDLKSKEIPQLNDNDFNEYRKILKYSQPKLLDYFNITKAFWSVVYDSIVVNVRKNKTNLQSKTGFFYYQSSEKLYVWKYTTRTVVKKDSITKTTIKLILEEDKKDLTITQIISKFYKEDKTDVKTKVPIFEVLCSDMFPLNETLVPIFKRKILSYINQQVNITKPEKKLLKNGIQ
jgi:succinate dehydrogenase flavin-adding protein (antitoxin of CptAB toxin-antitoxin module)